MDNRRFFLFVALGVILFLMYQAWQQDYAPKPTTYAATPAATAEPAANEAAAEPDEVPQAGPSAPTAGEPANAEPASLPPGEVLRSQGQVTVATDKLRVQIDRLGGDLRRVELTGIPISKNSEQSLHLLNDTLPNFFVMQSGLVDPAHKAPSHRSVFTAERDRYSLADGADTLEVPLHWEDAAGHSVTKVFSFKRGSYEIGLRQAVINKSAEPWTLSPYVQYWRTPYSESKEPPFVKSFMGVGFYELKPDSSNYRFRKAAFKDVAGEPQNLQQTGGWAAMLQHYFMAAIIPPQNETGRFFAKSRPLSGVAVPAYVTGFVGAQKAVAPGQTQNFDTQLFIGPKLQSRLDAVAPGLELAVDYGKLTIIAKGLFWVLDKLHGIVGNWGFAIILLTLLVKLALFKLSEHQYRSMAHMKIIAPRIQALKDRHAGDREGMNKAMMDLYKKEKFNPLGGCWPLLIQFPIFIALYWVLLDSVELRQAPFILWIQDMSAPDPFFVLPVLFGISMFVQQKLSGTSVTMDEVQQKVMMAMPVMLTVFFTFFPAGLVLYWLVSNLIGIGQQWFITRRLQREEARV